MNLSLLHSKTIKIVWDVLVFAAQKHINTIKNIDMNFNRSPNCTGLLHKQNLMISIDTCNTLKYDTDAHLYL